MDNKFIQNQDLYNENEQNSDNDNQDDEDDAYLRELHLKLVQMKQERKEAQQNAKLLDNRINMLKIEEEKNWRKIENKKKKANEKLNYLKSFADNINLLKNAKLKKNNEIEKQKLINKKLKDDIKNGIEAKKIEKQNQISEDAKLLKLQRQYNEQLIAFLKNEKESNNKAKCAIIKSQQSIEKEKKRMLEKERKAKLIEKLNKQLLEEYRLKEEADAKKNKAEKEETEVLKRLKNTTQIDKNISDEIKKMNLNSVMNGEYSNGSL